MRVEIPELNGRDVVVVNVLYSLPNVPDYLEVRPSAKKPFTTYPKDNPFQGFGGDLGASRKIKQVAERLLAKRITRQQAEHRIAVALRKWAREQSEASE